MEKIFLNALIKRYRFESPRGLLTSEELFLLTQTELDKMYRDLKLGLKDKEDGLLKNEESDSVQEQLKEQLSIIEFVFNYKEKKAAEEKEKKATAARKEHLLNILAKKKEESDENLSEEEITKLIKEL